MIFFFSWEITKALISETIEMNSGETAFSVLFNFKNKAQVINALFRLSLFSSQKKVFFALFVTFHEFSH